MINEGDVEFDSRSFIEDSDPAFKEFFSRFLELDSTGTQSNNQMFNNFISTTSGP